MTKLRSEFYFAVNDLWVAEGTLGSAINFDREGYAVEVRVPAHAKDFDLGEEIDDPAIGGAAMDTKGGPKRFVPVRIVQVMVRSDGPVSAPDFKRGGSDATVRKAIAYFKKAFAMAQAVAAESQMVVAWALVFVMVTLVEIALALKALGLRGAFWTIALVFVTAAFVLVPTPGGHDGSMLPSDLSLSMVNFWGSGAGLQSGQPIPLSPAKM